MFRESQFWHSGDIAKKLKGGLEPLAPLGLTFINDASKGILIVLIHTYKHDTSLTQVLYSFMIHTFNGSLNKNHSVDSDDSS